MKSVGCRLLNQLSQMAIIAPLFDFVLTANLSATQSVLMLYRQLHMHDTANLQLVCNLCVYHISITIPFSCFNQTAVKSVQQSRLPHAKRGINCWSKAYLTLHNNVAAHWK